MKKIIILFWSKGFTTNLQTRGVKCKTVGQNQPTKYSNPAFSMDLENVKRGIDFVLTAFSKFFFYTFFFLIASKYLSNR